MKKDLLIDLLKGIFIYGVLVGSYWYFVGG